MRWRDCLRAKLPQATPEQLDGERSKALRAPTIVVVAARSHAGQDSAKSSRSPPSAPAAQNMLLAAHALGYGAMWKTGAAAYDANVKAMLGLAAEDHIVAFLYLGTIATPGPLVPAPLDNIVTWLS